MAKFIYVPFMSLCLFTLLLFYSVLPFCLKNDKVKLNLFRLY